MASVSADGVVVAIVIRIVVFASRDCHGHGAAVVTGGVIVVAVSSRHRVGQIKGPKEAEVGAVM